jgi:hypothetical protein
LLVWTILNLLYCCLNFLSIRLYKNLPGFDSKFETSRGKKYFLRVLLWLGFGIGFLAVLRQTMLEERITSYEYFVWVGVFFFFIIGYLLRTISSFGKYFIYRRETLRTTCFSFNTTLVFSAIEFFGYSALVLLSFLISKNPFLLGGTIGLASGGVRYLLELTRKKSRSKIENNSCSCSGIGGND